MKKILIFILVLSATFIHSQTYEIILYSANVNEFDVIGEKAYEENNRIAEDITIKLDPSIGATTKAEPQGSDNFEAKNLIDGNLKTCWMSPNNGKNDQVELIIDLEENASVSNAQIKYIYFFNGWRKDYHTWKEYARIKKATMTVNDMPFAEISFEDTYKQQDIDLDKFKIDKSKRCRIKFRVSEIYPGSKYQQVALSDIQLIGKAK
jgi:hypothetical protein